MTSKPDTSAQAVERLAVEHAAATICFPDDVCRVRRPDCCVCARTAATLRALLTERDAARADGFRAGTEAMMAQAVEILRVAGEEFIAAGHASEAAGIVLCIAGLGAFALPESPVAEREA